MASRIQELAQKVIAGDARSAARAIRLVDDQVAGYLELLTQLYPHTGRAAIVGVTGTPGAGKSTLVERLIESYRAQDKKVGVLAVDPSSPYSGGAILGDRIRMQKHFLDPKVFIRSLATRGAMGGLSFAAMDVTRVLDAFGCDVIIVETVGVGQDELDVMRLAHTTVVVSAPGLGDDVQAVKAGVMEIADVFVVNKADRPGVDAAVADIEHMIAMGRETGASAFWSHADAAAAKKAQPMVQGGEDWIPMVIKTVAAKGEGIEELIAAIANHRVFLFESSKGDLKRKKQLRAQMQWLLEQQLLQQTRALISGDLDQALESVLEMKQDPYTVAKKLMSKVFGR